MLAIAKARCWIEDLVEGSVASFAEIAKREGRVKRHIRLLAPLAFVSPRVVSDIVDGSFKINRNNNRLRKELSLFLGATEI